MRYNSFRPWWSYLWIGGLLASFLSYELRAFGGRFDEELSLSLLVGFTSKDWRGVEFKRLISLECWLLFSKSSTMTEELSSLVMLVSSFELFLTYVIMNYNKFTFPSDGFFIMFRLFRCSADYSFLRSCPFMRYHKAWTKIAKPWRVCTSKLQIHNRPW